MDDLIEVELARITLQTNDDQHFVRLRERSGTRQFPIMIGFYEAVEIRRKLNKDDYSRPMTHDLIGAILDATDWKLTHVVVNALRDTTFFARLVLTQGDDEHSIDARPSDAIALAVQTGAKLFVAREVLDEVAPQPEAG